MSEELRQLFRNNSDCYADTHYYSDDTIPPTKLEGEVIQAMTEDEFVEIVQSKLKAVEIPSDYWKQRCELAEDYIDKSSCDPDIYHDQLEAYTKWQGFKNELKKQ